MSNAHLNIICRIYHARNGPGLLLVDNGEVRYTTDVPPVIKNTCELGPTIGKIMPDGNIEVSIVPIPVKSEGNEDLFLITFLEPGVRLDPVTVESVSKLSWPGAKVTWFITGEHVFALDDVKLENVDVEKHICSSWEESEKLCGTAGLLMNISNHDYYHPMAARYLHGALLKNNRAYAGCASMICYDTANDNYMYYEADPDCGPKTGAIMFEIARVAEVESSELIEPLWIVTCVDKDIPPAKSLPPLFSPDTLSFVRNHSLHKQ